MRMLWVNGKFLINNVCCYSTKIVDLGLYYCEYVSGDFKLHNHSEYKWVCIRELLSYNLVPADIHLVEYVIVYKKRVFSLFVSKCVKISDNEFGLWYNFLYGK